MHMNKMSDWQDSRMDQKEIYWLLDSRFDFLLPSFLREFGIAKQDMVLVNSYHGKARESWNKVYIPFERERQMIQMEPDDMNRLFSQSLDLDKEKMIISFSGAGLPQNDNLVAMMSTGKIAEKCNDKWWQYCQFVKNQISTPTTYRYCNMNVVWDKFDDLINKHRKLVIKKPCLSGGYQMSVLYSKDDLKYYQEHVNYRGGRKEILVSEYISHQQSFAAMGVVQKNGGVFVSPIITEQVLYHEVAYEGLLFPAFLNEAYQAKVCQITEKIGKMLGKNGYFGFYNVDFVLGTDNQIYVMEINARWGFGTILAACMYGEYFWKVMQGICIGRAKYLDKRLAIGKIKGREGKTYEGLKSYSGITEWFEKQDGCFQTFFCGTNEPERFEYGSYIGIFGEFFPIGDEREKVLSKFWMRCIEYY